MLQCYAASPSDATVLYSTTPHFPVPVPIFTLYFSPKTKLSRRGHRGGKAQSPARGRELKEGKGSRVVGECDSRVFDGYVQYAVCMLLVWLCCCGR